MNSFTLVELLIVISISVILVSASLSLYTFFSHQNLDLTRDEIMAVLKETQNRAILGYDGDGDDQSDNWGVHFENSSTDYYKVFYNSFTSSSTVSSYNLKRGVIYLSPSEGQSKEVIFSRITGLPNASSTIEICLSRDNSDSATITINENGKIEY